VEKAKLKKRDDLPFFDELFSNRVEILTQKKKNGCWEEDAENAVSKRFRKSGMELWK
jgi:hypothetical protein